MTSVPTTRPPDGFRQWSDPYGIGGPRPHHFEFVEIWYPFITRRPIIDPRTVHPVTNVAPWYWRPIKAFGEDPN